MAGDFPSNNMGCRIRFVTEPSVVGLIESARRRSLAPEMFSCSGEEAFPRPSFCRWCLEHNHMFPKAREASCVLVGLNEKRNARLFPSEHQKGKERKMSHSPEKGEPKPRGSSLNTNKAGSMQHNIHSVRPSNVLIFLSSCLSSSQYSGKAHF